MKEKLRTEVNFETKAGRTLIRKKDFYENGILAREGLFSGGGQWEWDIPAGLIKNYFKNGILKSEEHFDESGNRDGESKYFTDKGELLSKSNYAKDKLLSKEEFGVEAESRVKSKKDPIRSRAS